MPLLGHMLLCCPAAQCSDMCRSVCLTEIEWKQHPPNTLPFRVRSTPTPLLNLITTERRRLLLLLNTCMWLIFHTVTSTYVLCHVWPCNWIFLYRLSKEISKIMKSSYLRGLNMASFFCASKIIVFITFTIYVLLGNPITASRVFVTVSLYTAVRLTVTLFFPSAIEKLFECRVSIRRIQVCWFYVWCFSIGIWLCLIYFLIFLIQWESWKCSAVF